MASIVTIKGLCSLKGKDVGFQFQNKGGVYSAAGSFNIVPGDTAIVDAETLSGSFVVGQSFKCKQCGGNHMYQCGACGKFICYDGKARSGACPSCGKNTSVPAQKDDRIPRSGVATHPQILLAMDVSGSMYGGRLTETKNSAVTEFVRKFPGAKMALVTFESYVRTIVNFTEDLSTVERAINGLTDLGGTASPLPHILNNFQGFIHGSGDRYVVIFTDGAWDRGNHTADANAIKAKGIKIITIGCAGADRNFLQSIASPGASITTSDGNIGGGFAQAVKLIHQ